MIRARIQPLSRYCVRRFSSGVGTNPSTEPSRSKWSLGAQLCLALPITGIVAATSIATTVYSVEDIQKITQALEDSPSYTLREDATSLEKVQASLRSSARRVPLQIAKSYLRLRRMYDLQYSPLPEELPITHDVFTLVLDLNETLIFTGWTGGDKGWRTVKRPGVEDFLEQLSQFYEIIVFSDQLHMYADPIIDQLDTGRRISYRLCRGDMKYANGKRYKDLAKLKRDPSRIIWVSSSDNNLHRENMVQVQPWKGSPKDTALVDLIPFLKEVVEGKPTDVRIPLVAFRNGEWAPKDKVNEGSRRWSGYKFR